MARNCVVMLRRIRRKRGKRYVITRKGLRSRQYYCMQLDGYRWTITPANATVFCGREAVHREIESTWLQYESRYDITPL